MISFLNSRSEENSTLVLDRALPRLIILLFLCRFIPLNEMMDMYGRVPFTPGVHPLGPILPAGPHNNHMLYNFNVSAAAENVSANAGNAENEIFS